MLILEFGYGTCTSTPLVSQTSPHECIFLQQSVKISVFREKNAINGHAKGIPSTVFLRFHSFLHFQAIPYSWKNLVPVRVTAGYFEIILNFRQILPERLDWEWARATERLEGWKQELCHEMLLASRDRDVRSNKCRTKPRNQELLRCQVDHQ